MVLKNKKVKNIVLLAVTAVILVTAILLVATRKSGTLDKLQKDFAVKDTSAITKIFMADGYERQTLLERKDGIWLVNGKYEIVKDNIDDLLNCIYNLTVKDIVAKSARNTINKRMATGSTKVEIYYRDYRIKLGKLKLGRYINKKIYYIGQATMDNLGTYDIMEGSSIPCVVYLPGFRGYVSPKYSASEDAWKSRNIVRLRMSKIQQISSIDFIEPANSFRIVRSGNRSFDIIQIASNQKIPLYDTLRLLDFLSDFRDLNYESYSIGLTKAEKDTVFNRKFKEVKIEDIDGKITTISMFYLEDEADDEDFEDSNDARITRLFNRDRFYAIINGNKNELVRCQYFVFDRIVQPIEFFLPDSKILPIPKIYELDPEELMR
jgi:hypothetical protein